MPTKCLTFNNICAGRVFVIFRWETICYIFSAATASQATNGAEVREQQNEQSLRNNTETKTGKSLKIFNHKSQTFSVEYFHSEEGCACDDCMELNKNSVCAELSFENFSSLMIVR